MPFNNKRIFKRNPPKINTKNKQVHTYSIEPKYDYYGFTLYFTNEDKIDVETILVHIKLFEDYIARNKDIFLFKKIREHKFFVFDLNLLKRDEEFNREWMTFETDIIDSTEECLSCMGLAMHQMIIKEFNLDDKSNASQLPIIYARLINNEPIMSLKDLGVKSYGKLVTIKGTVIKAEMVKLLCQTMAFVCSYCGGTQMVEQTDGIYTPPVSCPTTGCNSHTNYKPLYSSSFTKTVNAQTIKIQELNEEEQYENGRIPRTVECDLIEDLVSCCIPGDDIIVTGIVKARNNSDSRSKQGSLFLLYLNTNSIINEKNQKENLSSSRITFTVKDYYAIKAIHSEVRIFRLLVHSLCPTIFGNELVKAGLLLALFGGSENDKNIRPDSHVLMVGDPGLGKSQLLQACSNVAPRGVYVCGNTTTGCGLTVNMTRASGGEYELEAGALVLADQGCCCIDEFDKMPTQHSCLLEAMEQQSVSIAKAGVTCNLPTRVSILAAANPIGGHYNKAKTILENLKIATPLLSRFDLIFVLLDKPNEEQDKMLSEHIINLHAGKKTKIYSTPSHSASTTSLIIQNSYSNSLHDRLKLVSGEALDPLPHGLLRKYIAYAKKYVTSKLDSGAKEVIKKFYLELRRKCRNGNSIPITTRQLESLIRMTQARAKLELREEATAEDAKDVVEIMKASLIDLFIDETGRFDFTVSQKIKGSGRNLAMKLLNLLQEIARTKQKKLFELKELKKFAAQVGIQPEKINDTLDALNNQGHILSKGQGNYQLSSY